MLEAVQELPLNFGFLGKGNDSLQPALMEQIAAKALGGKTTRRSTPATIEPAPNVDDKTDTQFILML
jgi:urease subunit alpha